MRPVVGASLEVIRAKRNIKPEVREAARQQAIKEAKDASKAKQAARKAEKAKVLQYRYFGGLFRSCSPPPSIHRRSRVPRLARPSRPRSPSSPSWPSPSRRRVK